MKKLMAEYLFRGVTWGCFWLVVVCVILEFTNPDALQGLVESFTLHALGSVAVGIGSATTPIVYEIDRLRRWQQVLIHAVVGLGVFFSVAFGLGWLPSGSLAAVMFSVAGGFFVFFVIWLGFYFYSRFEVKKINDRIKAKQGGKKMNITALKENLRDFYNADAQGRNARGKDDFKIAHRQAFCDMVIGEAKKTLLELGAGTGHDSEYFAGRGLDVTAVDLSPEMVKLCREKGINAHELDFYNLQTLNKKFDCVWAVNSLLHVPKADLRRVLTGISDVLNENGLFYMGVWGGKDSEHEWVLEEVCEKPRFFSFFSEEKLKEAVESVFEIISFEQIETPRGDLFQATTMRKRAK
jgi:SAM-dependent methyltransferase